MYDRSLGPWVDNRIKYFVAAHPRNTTTGVLRNRVIRYNSTVMCSSSQQYPALCSGKRPFEAFFGREGDLQARICVSGERGVHPWTISRDLQTINETVVLHMDNVVNGTRVNLTQTCSVITDRGYFELGMFQKCHKLHLRFVLIPFSPNRQLPKRLHSWPASQEMGGIGSIRIQGRVQ